MIQSAPPQDAVSVLNNEFLVDPPSALSIDVPGAVTTLRPNSENDRAMVEVSVAGCEPDEAESILERLQIEADVKQDTIYVYSAVDRTDAKWWRWVRTLDVTIHIDLQVPSPVELDIDAPGGAVDIANVDGQFDLDVMGGPCALQNLDGTLDLRAESSDVTIEHFSGGRLVAHVSVGTLALNDVDVDTMILRSVCAPLSLGNAEGDTTITANSASVEVTNLDGPCSIQNQGGSLTYEGTPTTDTNLKVVGASLDVQLPTDHNADLTMRAAELSLDDALSFSGERTDHTIEGVLNDGGPKLTLKAVGGTAVCTTS